MKTKLLSGQTLVETVAALAVAIIIVAALVGMSVTSLRASNLSRSKAIAAQLLSEETERARIYRDTNSFSGLVAGLSLGAQVCPVTIGPLYIDSGQTVVAGSEAVTTSALNFTRSFVACFTNVAANVIEISATVSWTDSTGTHPVKSTTYLSNWR